MSAGAKSVVSNDIQELGHGKEDTSNRASGLKAAMSNPNVSDEAKAEAERKFKELGGESAFYGKTGDKDSKNAHEKLEGDRAAR